MSAVREIDFVGLHIIEDKVTIGDRRRTNLALLPTPYTLPDRRSTLVPNTNSKNFAKSTERGRFYQRVPTHHLASAVPCSEHLYLPAGAGFHGGLDHLRR